MSDIDVNLGSGVVRVLYFAAARDAVGLREENFAAPDEGTTLEAIANEIYARHPTLVPYARSLRLAINGEYARGTDRVLPGDEVAVIPPVAGG